MEKRLGLDTSLEAELRGLKGRIDNREPDAEDMQRAFVELLDLLIEREKIRPKGSMMQGYQAPNPNRWA